MIWLDVDCAAYYCSYATTKSEPMRIKTGTNFLNGQNSNKIGERRQTFQPNAVASLLDALRQISGK